MNLSLKKLVIVSLAALLYSTSHAQTAKEGAGQVKIGYTYVDEEGNLSVNQETYNVYEGTALSLTDWSYFFQNGVSINADLDRITLNNRNLRAIIRKPGLFTLSGFNNQYRRIYDFNGTKFTRRRSSGGSAMVQPHRKVKLFGGYNVTEKHGNNFGVLSPISDTILFSSDYTHSSYNVGSQVNLTHGFIRAEYRRYTFEDNARRNSDRESDNMSVIANYAVPKYDWIVLSGGYNYRSDKLDERSLELKTNQGWGATKVYLPRGFIFDYRILFARTKHTGTSLETDNVINTAALGKSWRGYGGLRLGYENRIADDLVDRTESHNLIVSGWYNFRKRLFARLRVSTRRKDVVTGATLVGDEEVTLHRLSLKYVDSRWGFVSALWQGRLRENKDIRSRVDYNVLTGTLSLRREKCGRMELTYSYYVGEYENRSDAVGFEFSDHVVSGMIYPREFRSLSLEFGGSYYRSQRDVDVEKFSLNFGAMYAFAQDYHLEVKYHVFNYDDLITLRSYYTANIVEVNLIKDIKL